MLLWLLSVVKAQTVSHYEYWTDDNYADRTMDIDLIRTFDDEGKEIIINYQFSNFSLILPHPLWQQRDFVRIPLQEIFLS